ncbi:kinase-like protein [Apiospora kogelbergensis]|uniref:non-specific serine/threonine protein kinase n=1 Tax=Apiospora kogelbergensis TaxID=1337665 RepID=A0AAW0Q6A7_9PEZI
MPKISQILVEFGKRDWSLRPRTFAVLWILGIPEALDVFVAQDRTDHYLPYNQGNLPDAIKGSSLRDQFLQLQDMVKCRQEDIAELEIGGKHLSLTGNADAYFISEMTLGQGRFALVDKVRSMATAGLFARKRIFRGESALQDHESLVAFEKELKSLKKLSHHHVVKLVGSYTDSTSLGIIMSPIADMDLQAYLNSNEVDPEHRRRMLRCFFGSLATALAYIHGKNIRHKDIKPNNVLVKGDKVFLSDFGTSRVCLEGHLTTRGGSPEGTPRYWAPEVGDGADRNTASDIWSLGCVFLEMATTLFRYSHNDMLRFYSEHGTENCHRFSLNQGGTEAWIKHLSKDVHITDNVVLQWAASMLQFDPQERPTAAQLRGRILDVRSGVDYICQCCSTTAKSEASICCPPPQGVDTTDIPTKCIDVGESDVLSSRPPTPPPEYVERQKEPPVPTKPKVHFENNLEPPPARQQGPSRFTGLSDDRRPKPTIPSEDTFTEAEQTDFMAPDPLRSPSFDSYQAPLPAATLVPSYILTGHNRLSEREVQNDFDSHGLCNVFVYGRLMFPSVLHAIASQSIDGVYAPNLQRRIYPVSSDWNKANFSIQRASEIMTPAKLNSFDRWQPSRLDCAAIDVVTHTPKILERRKTRKQRTISPPGHVFGNLVVGLKMEAVKYLDLLLASNENNLSGTQPKKKEDGKDDFREDAIFVEPPLVRKTVMVQVKSLSGKTVETEAYTYVWNLNTDRLGRRWKEDSFVRGRSFQELLVANDSWYAQEKALARVMRITYAQLGDAFCEAILAGDREQVEWLLYQGWDPDAPCKVYGTPLQAAVVTGREDMARLLVEHNSADVNARGGQYGTALVAAAYASRKGTTRLLLERGADVFATDPVHVNALYQAVGHADYAIAEMLLEHGAWLVEDWAEVCDLAAETGDDEIVGLLRQYDIRHMYRQQRRHKGREEPQSEVEGDQVGRARTTPERRVLRESC